MTLDEAIKHAEEVAKKQENNAKSYPRPDKSVKGSGRKYNAYLKCAEEHRQLAEWLKDYKRLLEQEPCEDAISRQALINKAISWNKHFADSERYVSLTDIQNAPSVTPQEPKTGWIPVSEKLPNECDYKSCYEVEDGAVLLTNEEGLVGMGYYYESTKTWSDIEDNPIAVIAWMPLPEPYKASTTGAEGSE